MAVSVCLSVCMSLSKFFIDSHNFFFFFIYYVFDINYYINSIFPVGCLPQNTGLKQYKCKVCGKEFSQSGNLRKHLATHPAESQSENTAPANPAKQSQEDPHTASESLFSVPAQPQPSDELTSFGVVTQSINPDPCNAVIHPLTTEMVQLPVTTT